MVAPDRDPRDVVQEIMTLNGISRAPAHARTGTRSASLGLQCSPIRWGSDFFG